MFDVVKHGDSDEILDLLYDGANVDCKDEVCFRFVFAFSRVAECMSSDIIWIYQLHEVCFCPLNQI